MTQATTIHAIHEAGHALLAHLCGLTIRSVRIDVSTQSGTDVDRGYDPVSADQELRGTATNDRVRELLPFMQRDLAVALGGIAAEQMHNVYADGDPENAQDEHDAALLADNVVFARWRVMEPRMPLSNRESAQEYLACMRSFVEQLVETYAAAVTALARTLESTISISGDATHLILQDNGVEGGMVAGLP